MSEAEDNVEEVVVPRRSTRQRTVKKLDDDYEYEAPTKKKTTPKKNPATKRKASTEEEQEEDVKPSSTILLSSPPPKPVETKKTKKRKTKKEKEEEQRESLKMREKMHKEMQEAKEMEKRNMEEMIKRENEKKLLEEEAKKKEEEETKSSAASTSASSTTTKKVKKKKSKKVVQPQKVDMSDDSSSSEEEDISRGFSDLQRVVNLSNGLEKPVLIHGGFIKVLKPHQLEGVRFCWKHISLGRGCVLAHSMGLGKTLQMITLAHTLLISSNYKTRRFLIVCPKSVILNWDAEFRKWLDQCVGFGISIRTIKDKDKTNESRLFKLEKWKNKGGVLILSFQMFHRFLGHYNKEKDIMSLNMQKNELQQYKVQRDTRKRLGVSTIDLEATIKDLAEQIEKAETRYQQRDEFEQKASDIIINSTQLVIVDEAHRMCSNTDIFINQALNRLDTQYRIALTGTPIQNNLMEYYAMINWVRKGYWTNEEFFAFFSKPIQSGMRKDSDDKAVEEMKKSSFLLVKELEEFIHRRDQSVLRDSLPPKHEYVISFRVNPLQARLYKAFADARQREERKFGSASGSGLFDPKFYSQPLTREQVDKSSKTLFYLSVLLNKITNHPDLVRLYCERREFTFEDCLKHPGVFITREEMQEKRHLKELEEEEGMEDDEEPETPPKIKKSESPIKTTSSVKYEPLKRESTPSSSSVKNEPISLDDDDEDLFSMDLLSSISSQPKTPASSTTKKESPFADKKVQPKKEESPPPKTKKSSAKKSKAKKEENNDTPKSKKNKIVSSLDEEDNLEEEFEAAEEVMGNNLFWAAPVLSQEYKLFNARNSPKMEFLLRLIEKCYLNNEKILIFTQYVEMLDVMEGVFKNTPIVVGTEEDDDGNLVPIKKNLAKGDDYFRLDGSISGQKRQDLVDNFTPESTAHVFIISTKAGGLGINLVAATRVVIFDPCWNDTWDKQALFRAYRYGQTKPVYVYRFVTYGSAEEKIFNLSTAKAWLAKRIVDDKTPDLIMKKGDLEILNQALSIEETMRDKLLLNPKQYQEDSFLNDLLGVNWEYSEEVIDPLKPVHHIVIDEEEEKPEEKVKKPDTFYPEEEEDPSGEFNVQRKIKSVFRYDSLFVENEKLRLEESEQERSINEYEQKRKEVRENPGKLLAEIMSDDLYDPSVLISPSSLVPPTMGSVPPDSPLTPMIDSTRLALLARLQQFIQSQDNNNNQEANDVDREASTTLNSMWQKVSANEDVMKMINKIRKRRQRTLASQGLSSSPANTPTTPSQPPSSFTFDALQNNYHSSPTQQQAFSFTNPTQASQGFSMMPPPSSSSVASASSPRTSMFSIPVVSLDEPVEIQPRPASTTKRTNVFTNSISLDSDDDE